MKQQMSLKIITFCIVIISLLPLDSIISAQSDNPPFSLAWSPDGTMIAGAGNGILRVWDSLSGSPLINFPSMDSEFVTSVSWSADSTRIVTASSDQTVRIWNVSDPNYMVGQVIFSAQPFIAKGILTSVDWSSDGNQIAIGGSFGGPTLEIRDAGTFQIIGQFGGGWIERLKWHPDPASKQLAVADDNTDPVIISSVNPNTVPPVQIGNRDLPAGAIAWNSDGSKLAVGYDSGVIDIWDISTNTLSVTFSTGTVSRIHSLAWSSDDTRIASANGNIQVWDSVTGSLTETLPGTSLAVDFSPDGTQIVVASSGADIEILPAPQPNQSPTADAGPDQTLTDSDDDGSELVTLDGSGSSDPDGTIESYIWTENDVEIATGVNPQVSLSVGVHTITLTVTDDDGATDTDEVVITISR